MENHKVSFVVIVSIIIILGLSFFLFYSKKDDTLLINNPDPVSSSVVEYRNTEYGFTFSLPDDWLGYSIINNTWTGYPLLDVNSDETGERILIRNPKWTADMPYEDIPILVFSLAQWKAYKSENFAISAAPIPATELARNNSYVFALPPRWDFDYAKGYEQAQDIVNSNPLKTFDINKIVLFGDGQQCYTYNHEGTADEPYTVSEFIDIIIQGKTVNGVKKGSQSGPDMTNSYNGILTGTINGNLMDILFSYSIEGSSNKEKEIYKIREDETGIEKIRYPLIEENGMLVPDKEKEFKTLFYSRVDCSVSN